MNACHYTVYYYAFLEARFILVILCTSIYIFVRWED
jgi:hypothetical protein